MKRHHPDELPTDTEQRHIDAIAKAERSVVLAAERWRDVDGPAVAEARALDRAVDGLRQARKAKAT